MFVAQTRVLLAAMVSLARLLVALATVTVAGAAPTFVDAAKCAACHKAQSDQLAETLHPKMIVDVKATPKANIGDWTKLTTNIPTATLKLDQFVYTLGSKYRQRDVASDGGDLVIAPVQWNNAAKKWTVAALL